MYGADLGINECQLGYYLNFPTLEPILDSRSSWFDATTVSWELPSFYQIPMPTYAHGTVLTLHTYAGNCGLCVSSFHHKPMPIGFKGTPDVNDLCTPWFHNATKQINTSSLSQCGSDTLYVGVFGWDGVNNCRLGFTSPMTTPVNLFEQVSLSQGQYQHLTIPVTETNIEITLYSHQGDCDVYIAADRDYPTFVTGYIWSSSHVYSPEYLIIDDLLLGLVPMLHVSVFGHGDGANECQLGYSFHHSDVPTADSIIIQMSPPSPSFNPQTVWFNQTTLEQGQYQHDLITLTGDPFNVLFAITLNSYEGDCDVYVGTSDYPTNETGYDWSSVDSFSPEYFTFSLDDGSYSERLPSLFVSVYGYHEGTNKCHLGYNVQIIE